MFFCDYGEFVEQAIFTHQFWSNYIGSTKYKQATKQPSNLGQDQRNKNSTKNEITLCAARNRNFKTARGLTEQQKKCTPCESTYKNYVAVHNITL